MCFWDAFNLYRPFNLFLINASVLCENMYDMNYIVCAEINERKHKNIWIQSIQLIKRIYIIETEGFAILLFFYF